MWLTAGTQYLPTMDTDRGTRSTDNTAGARSSIESTVLLHQPRLAPPAPHLPTKAVARKPCVRCVFSLEPEPKHLSHTINPNTHTPAPYLTTRGQNPRTSVACPPRRIRAASSSSSFTFTHTHAHTHSLTLFLSLSLTNKHTCTYTYTHSLYIHVYMCVCFYYTGIYMHVCMYVYDTWIYIMYT